MTNLSSRVLGTSIAFVAIVVFAGWYVIAKPVLQTSPTPTGQDLADDRYLGWHVYKNDTYGFRFSYPRQWEVKPLKNVQNPYVAYFNVGPTGADVVDLAIMRSMNKADYLQTHASYTLVSSDRFSADGMSGMKYVFKAEATGGATSYLYSATFEKNGFLYELFTESTSYRVQFDLMAPTFSFIQ